MRKRLITLLCFFQVSSFLFLPTIALADPADPSADLLGVRYGQEAGLSKVDPRIVVAQIIQVSLGLLGIVAIAFIVYAGYLWLTSGGNEEQVKNAQQTIFRAVIGLLIIFSAYSITVFVISSLSRATTGFEYQLNTHGLP